MVKPWALLDNQPFVLNHLLQYNNKQYPIQDQKTKMFIIALSLLTSISSALAPEGVILMLGKPSKKKFDICQTPPVEFFLIHHSILCEQ